MKINFNEFIHVSRELWVDKVNMDFKGKNPSNELKYCVEPGLEVDPFLTWESSSNRFPVLGPKTRSGVYIDLLDSFEANQLAIEILSNGAASLAFDIDEKTNFNVLFEGIYLNLIRVVLVVKSGIEDVTIHLNRFFDENFIDYRKEIMIKCDNHVAGYNNVVISLESDMSHQNRLNLIVSSLAEYIVEGFENPVIEISLKQDFLAQIAELRAIRILWANLLNSNNIPLYPLTIISSLDTRHQNIMEKHPLIAVNYMLMSAYFGMSDLAFGCPTSENKDIARLSLNIQHIFKEESLFSVVSDPTAGSYIIENLTDNMVENTLRG